MGASGSRVPGEGKRPERTEAGLVDRLNEVGAAMLAIDPDRRLIQWDGAAERMFGFSREEAMGHTVDELGILPRESALRMRQVLFDGPERPVSQDMPMRRRDGTTFPAFIRMALAFGGDGEILGTTGIVLDASEARRADTEIPTPQSFGPAVEVAALALSGAPREELLKRCLGLVKSALGVDRAGLLVPAKGGAGLELESGVGWAGERPGEPLDLAVEEVAMLAPTDVAVLGRIPPGGWLAGNGIASGLVTPVSDGARDRGVLAALSSVPRDFSDQERAFLKALALTLSANVEMTRARELESRFHRASRMEAMGQLTGGIAHDFNNLLAVILNYAAFAREEIRAGDDSDESLAEIERAARKASELTHQLLVFSRQEAVALEAIDVTATVAEARGLLSLTLGDQIVCDIEAEPALGVVELGRGQLEQVLVNLAVNARDAMPDGGSFRICVESAHVDDARDWIRMTVADTGVGMPADVQEKAFEPFFTTKPIGKGSGFGLATVFGIVSGVGGSIEIHSEPGRGTEFEILLPVAAGRRAPGGEVPEPSAPENARRVLLVEDDEMVRRLTARLLRRGGYEVVEAGDPEEAVDLVASDGATGDGNGDFALLLTDVVMPKATGVELALRVRELLPEISVVFMSGYTGEAVSREAVYEIEGAFVEKPFTPETLFESVERALRRG